MAAPASTPATAADADVVLGLDLTTADLLTNFLATSAMPEPLRAVYATLRTRTADAFNAVLPDAVAA